MFKLQEKVFIKTEGVPGIIKTIEEGKVGITFFPKNSKERQFKQFESKDIAKFRKHKKQQNIFIKYFDGVTEKIEKIAIGNWIDLRSAEDIELKQFEYKLIPLGIAMKLPKGYEANIVPRSSTFKNFGILQTNHFGVIDESYCGPNDQWYFPALAMRDTAIKKGDRICQFRINRIMSPVNFIEVKELKGKNRNGFGSTGAR